MAESTSQPSSSGPGPGQGGPPPENPLMSMILMMGALFIIMWLLVIRPQKKEQRRKEDMLSRLKKNDEVMTLVGIYGKVVEIDGDNVVLLVDPKKDVKIRMRRAAIEGILTQSQEDEKK